MRPACPELHVITSGRHERDHVLRMAEAANKGGMTYLHIREKHRTAQEIAEWVEALAGIIPRVQIIVNDRVDVAAAYGCGGSHLAYHSLSPEAARRILRSNQLIGRSVHSLEEACLAAEQGADYLLYGHIFASGSKPGLAPRGTEELRTIVSRVDIPVIGLGGIRPELVPQVMGAGCKGIAVLSGITDAEDYYKAARAYREALDHWEENTG
ncbi:thiamine phosphate synthase [Brevibacillus ruminantium]|uniref:Thiamine-phosphate synthase n=1 Tax=Brevibacillus ruminantium TaxID=2950604 RepID=A0ABY4WPP8_9BACL|nr:thiamine phosphate synthase [Brevibacillus ruminantium]USG68123.1 thiamine phosphate synthase [Brevibacillus ruminantium]